MKLLIEAKIRRGNEIDRMRDILSAPPSAYIKLFR